MSNLIINGDFANKELAPWTSTSPGEPVFDSAGQSGAYSLLVEPNSQISQQIRDTGTAEFRPSVKFSARIKSPASLAGSIAVVLSARDGFDSHFDVEVFTGLKGEWQTFEYKSKHLFPAVHEGFYVQLINARTFENGGEANAPILVSGIEVLAGQP